MIGTIKTREGFYFGTLFLGIILLILEIDLYRRTFIPIAVPLFVTCMFTLISFLIIKSDYNKTYGESGSFYAIAQSLISFGFIGCFCFMSLNYYLAERETQSQIFAIKNRHSIGTRQPNPAIEIEYNNTIKQLVFKAGQQEKPDEFDSVLLITQKGFFGFDIIKEMTLHKRKTDVPNF